VGGAVLAMKGAAAKEELAECANAIKKLGLKLEAVKEYPIDGTAHAVIVLRKVAPTPAKFPRRFAQIKKSPL
jgi:16S rRNA (guanine527-N7)-methyltransferase